jgi:hypothetical protein
MNSISVIYNYNYRLSFANNYVFTKNGKCFNLKTNREIKMVLNGYTKGFNIQGKFYSLNTLRKNLEKIPKETCPF